MRCWVGLPWILTLAIGFSVGCGDVAERPETAPVSLVITDGEGLEGVELCQTNTNNCAVSDAGGNAAIAVPVGQEISYTLEKEGYDSILFADIVSASGRQAVFDLRAYRVETVAGLYASVDSSYPRLGTGEIFIIQTFGTMLQGVTCNLAQATGKRYYEEGSFAAGNLTWSLDLTGTTSKGACGFVEVAPGTFRVEFGGATRGCLPRTGSSVIGGGWPGDREGSIRVPVEEGHVTNTLVICADSP